MDSTRKVVAICQAKPASGSLRESVAIIITWMEKASQAGADIALFGELFLSNYDLDNIRSLSETKDGSAAKCISEAAKRLGIAVIYGYSEVENSYYFDSLMFIDSQGRRLANYRKVHVWPGTEDLNYKCGDVPVVVDWCGLKIGMAICVDVCMSEFIAVMAANGGAQLIVVATALVDSPRYDNTPVVIVPARAFENRCYIAYVDLAGEKYSGMSRLCDPYAHCLVSSQTNDEAMLLSTIDMKKCDEVPFRYHSLRRPEVYTIPYKNENPWTKDKPEGVQSYFKNRACYYDRQMDGIYSGPAIAANALSGLVEKKAKKVLDVAAGTGLVGKALSEKGFTNIIALDRSEEMLKHSSSKNVYSDLICGPFEVKAKSIPDQSFHVCICVGAFLTQGFLDPTVTIYEMVRIVEEGGIILLLVNATELEEPQCKEIKKSLESACDGVVKKRMCSCLQMITVSKYLEDCEGKMWIFKKK